MRQPCSGSAIPRASLPSPWQVARPVADNSCTKVDEFMHISRALDAGGVVAADARLLDAQSLRCVESALTGEAEPASKRSACFNHA
jgi:hypothetical protein